MKETIGARVHADNININKGFLAQVESCEGGSLNSHE